MKRQATAAIAAFMVVLMGAPALAEDDAPAKRKRHGPPSFATVDANKDGSITADEIKAMLAKNPRMAKHPDRLTKRTEKVFKRLDKNGDGSIDQAEFKALGGRGRGKRKRGADENKDHE